MKKTEVAHHELTRETSRVCWGVTEQSAEGHLSKGREQGQSEDEHEGTFGRALALGGGEGDTLYFC